MSKVKNVSDGKKSKLAEKSSLGTTYDYEPPLDYTFMYLTSVADCLEEEPRERNSNVKTDTKEEWNEPVKRKTKALRLSNNVISDWDQFSSTIDSIVEKPDELEWIDLSFNDLTTVDECLLRYKNLKVLYLHGNSIEKLTELDKLTSLPCLHTLTLHGNPMEDIRKGYRQYVLSKMPNLKNFDFSGVTKSDRADTQMYKVKKTKKKQQE